MRQTARGRLMKILALFFLSSAAIAATPPKAVDLPNDRLFPESMSITPDGTAFVGSMTGGVLKVSMKTGKAEQWIAPGERRRERRLTRPLIRPIQQPARLSA